MFKPRRDVLPPEQQSIWPELAFARQHHLVLYGGTAIALRAGHRRSVDFDFFTHEPLDKTALRATPLLRGRTTVLQDAPETLTVHIGGDENDADPVKVSFFGGLDFGHVDAPDLTDDGILEVASPLDLMATKLKVLLERVEAKDYRDIVALLDLRVSLARGLAATRALYGDTFQPCEALKALTYFEGGDLDTLDRSNRETLITACRSVTALPRVTLAAHILTSTRARD